MSRAHRSGYDAGMTDPIHERLPEALPAEPLLLVEQWLSEAMERRVQPNPNAMVLATADAAGHPSARVVLCKHMRTHPGYVTFYTNYDSRKGRELAANTWAAAVFHWDTLRRQIRLEGRVTAATASESDTYFASRHWQSRLGAWASRQSSPIGSRADLHRALQDAAQRFSAPSPLSSDATAPDPGRSIPRPPNWGGYHLWIAAVELWVEGDARLHDRARWERPLQAADGGYEGGPWQATRLAP
jgi:pyridoxamine 5'-phosphate oxidase